MSLYNLQLHCRTYVCILSIGKLHKKYDSEKYHVITSLMTICNFRKMQRHRPLIGSIPYFLRFFNKNNSICFVWIQLLYFGYHTLFFLNQFLQLLLGTFIGKAAPVNLYLICEKIFCNNDFITGSINSILQFLYIKFLKFIEIFSSLDS